MDLNIRIAGEAGQGIKTTGHLLVDAFASMGLWVFSTQSYMSRIRGGLNWQDVRIADYPITSGREGYRRYEITDSGVSPRALPGGEAFVVLDSDEHDEEGHITENLEIAQAMIAGDRDRRGGAVRGAFNGGRSRPSAGDDGGGAEARGRFHAAGHPAALPQLQQAQYRKGGRPKLEDLTPVLTNDPLVKQYAG